MAKNDRDNPKPTVAVIYGGRSGEHEVSLQSAASVMAALDRSRYRVRPVFVDHDGRWHAIAKGRPGRTAPAEQLLRGVNVVFPLIHGTFGEDGCLQGFLETVGLPYVGSGVLGSAVGMDKDMQKKVLARDGLPVVPWLAWRRREWRSDADALITAAERKFGYPIFVKPARLGSSVGISKAHDRNELRRAVVLAFRYDDKVVVEKGIERPREIEIGVIGNDVVLTTVPGEIKPSNEFYDYAAKYLDGRSIAVIPADLTPAQKRTARRLAAKTYRSLEASGYARVDLLMGRRGRFYVNEINTIPGFTRISMFPKMWTATGLRYSRLLDRLIGLAVERDAAARRLIRTFGT